MFSVLLQFLTVSYMWFSVLDGFIHVQMNFSHLSSALSHLPPSSVKHTSPSPLSYCLSFFPMCSPLRAVNMKMDGRLFTRSGCSSVEQHLPSMQKALGSILSVVKQTDNWNISREIINTLYLKVRFKSICSQNSGFVHVYSCFWTIMIN